MTDSGSTSGPGGLVVTQQAGVTHLCIDRPGSGNAIDLPTARLIRRAAAEAAADESTRAVLITGAGHRFCTGGDLRAMSAAPETSAYVRDLAATLDEALAVIDGLAKPVVCAVQGVVAGAGLAVMLAADLVLAEEGCRFAMAYAGVGLTPDCGVSWLLPRAVGQVRAMELALTDRILGAEDALDWGLVGRVVPDAREAAEQLAHGLARRAPVAAGHTRRLLRSAWVDSRAAVGADESRTIAAMVTTDAARHLIGEFTRVPPP